MRWIMLFFALFSCGEAPPANGPPKDVAAPVTTITPEDGTASIGALTITLTASEPATIRWTLDGTDPATSPTAKSGPSPQSSVVLPPAKLLVRYFSTDAAGNRETERRAGFQALEQLRPASLSGTVHTHASVSTGFATVYLFTSDPLAAGGPRGIAASASLGAVAPLASFRMEGVAAGKYWLAAVVFKNQSPAPREDPIAYAGFPGNPVELDPAVAEKSRLDFADLFIGSCDPSGAGFEGTITLGEEYASAATAVIAVPGEYRIGAPPQPRWFAASTGSGTTRHWAHCGPPESNLSLFLAVARNGNFDHADHVVAFDGNPAASIGVVPVDFAAHTPKPGKPSITGQLKLGAPLPGGVAEVYLTTGPFGSSLPPVMFALDRLTFGENTTETFRFDGLDPARNYFVATRYLDASSHEAFTLGPQGITAGPGVTPAGDLVLPGGRISGSVRVEAASRFPALRKIALSAVPSASGPPAANTVVELGAPNAADVRTATFTLFGLPDGSYAVAAAADLDDDGDFVDDLTLGHAARSATDVAVSQSLVGSADVVFVDPGI